MIGGHIALLERCSYWLQPASARLTAFVIIFKCLCLLFMVTLMGWSAFNRRHSLYFEKNFSRRGCAWNPVCFTPSWDYEHGCYSRVAAKRDSRCPAEVTQ